MDVSPQAPLLQGYRIQVASQILDTNENSPVYSDGVSIDLIVQRSSGSQSNDLKRRIGLGDGIALVLGIQIGSGIFVSPSLVALNAGSEFSALLAWLAAGTLAWSCAVCYIELSNYMPVNGGPQEFLTVCFNDTYGFVASWTCIFVAKPCSTAMLALIISEYLCDAFRIPLADIITRKTVALCVVSLAALVNCLGNGQSKALTKLLLGCKLISVGFVLVMGLPFILLPVSNKLPPTSVQPMDDSQPTVGGFADAVLIAMWAYSGWETVCFPLRVHQ
ncbi:hypothetical protein ABW20_dc0109035 [Dactylellina cionopaga]|nr:hypothetical protein ABW20_dc0109035 [Dactylellina cionopaga]